MQTCPCRPPAPSVPVLQAQWLLQALVPTKLLLFCLFRATLLAHGGSQARGPIGAAAAGLHPSHSNARSEPRPRPTPQLTATPDP